MQHGAGLVERPLAATSLGDCMLQLLQQVVVASATCKVAKAVAATAPLLRFARQPDTSL